jgi:glutathione peroxidase
MDLPNSPLRTIDGTETTIQAFKGNVLLIVNVASECGYTTQYEGLQALHQKYQNRGFSILAFPCNDFGGQEPGNDNQIRTFCKTRYSVTFQLFSKIQILGATAHPLFTALTGPNSPFPGPVSWNFTKFLISRDGKLLARFGPETEPDSPELISSLQTALTAGKLQ